MKKIELNQLEVLIGGDDFDDFVGGLACGAALASLFLPGGFITGFIPALGCANYIRNNS